jgi:UDP-N-acetylglucosamine--N-acetylmuramyl-(pentapeptide) pyrophosphoryl-undecaprenol N-acetylglucosamine transferase
MRVVIAGGGTVGHVQPALALAHALQADDVSFIGTARGAEARLVSNANLPFSSIDISGFDRARPLSLLTLVPKAAGATIQARALLRQRQADAVVGMGGYVSLPVCMAARSMGIPVVLHEQNIVLGLANRVCKPLAFRVAVSWKETLASAGSKGVFTGNPVLPGIAHLDRENRRSDALARFNLDPSRKTLLVFGGSQGARRINEAIVGLSQRWRHRSDRQILHLVGASEFDLFRAKVAHGGELRYEMLDFLSEMIDAYSVADLALCRGGATTLAELTAVGLPAIIVPYPWHRDHQQERHAEVLATAGAAVALPDPDTTTESVEAIADPLLDSDDSLLTMSKASLQLGHPDAAQHLAGVVHGRAA